MSVIRLSIITAVRNLVLADRVAKFRQCVKSVHSQSCIGDLEHIVVDGASTDGTSKILEEYAKHGWIDVITKPDHSVYEAMNNGLNIARGKYVLFLNSDDFLFNRSGLKKTLREVEAANADYCIGDVDVLDDKDYFDSIWHGGIDGLPFATNYCHRSMLFKTELLRAYGGFDLRYKVSSDSDLMLRLFKENRHYIHSRHSFACYRSGGLSTRDRATAQSDHADAFFKYFGREVGLSLEDCRGLWDYSVLRDGNFSLARSYVDKLPIPEWRHRLEEMIVEFEHPRTIRTHGLSGLWYSLTMRWRNGGLRCIVKGIENKFRKLMP